MAFFPDVSRGDPFQPNALLSNNLRHIVNLLNGCQNGGQLGSVSGIVKINVYCTEALAAGTAVNFAESGELCGDAVPCEKLKDSEKPWGVIVRDLEAEEIGSCIISGPARVSISGSSGDYAKPVQSDPVTFQRGATGAQILFVSGDKAVLNLGAATQENYTGPFALSYDAETKKLKVAGGYLNRNGEFAEVPETELDPATGEVCVCTDLDDDGYWSEPEIRITQPTRFAYPVGSCKVDGESVTLCNFRVPVAVFIVTGECDSE